MVNSYLASGEIAPQILFYNGPSATPYTTARDAFYNWSATPTFQIDGCDQQLGWSQTACQNYINSRLAVPSYVDIDVNMVGDSYGGTAYYTINVESDPGVSGEIKVWSAIVESNKVASSSYGVYTGQTLMWDPVAFPLGYTGQVITLSGSYPQTINVSGDYTLDPGQWTFDNLDIVTYVQASTGNKEVLNADFMDVPDTATGIYGDDVSDVQAVLMNVGPNPTTGLVSIDCSLPEGTAGTVKVFDLAGRVVHSFQAQSSITTDLEENGVYFVRLTTSSGEVIDRRLTVIR